MTTFGIDVSEYQAGLALADAQAAGARFVIARATRGPGLYTDPEFRRFRDEAKALTLPFAAYHFIGAHPLAEAEHIASVVGRRTPIMLDLESSEKWGTHPTYDHALELRAWLVAHGRRVPLLYYPGWYWAQTGRPDLSKDGWGGVVQSRYSRGTLKGSIRDLYLSDQHPEGWGTYGGVTPLLWQYTSTAVVPRYTRNTVDADAFRGNLQDLRAASILRWWDDGDTVTPMTWRVADSLQTLLAEVNRVAPNRSTLSDGSIGDAAHASRSSDHNPWITVAGVGVVRARDFTHDTDGGPTATLDADRLAAHVAALLGKHPALDTGAYVIRNRRIISTDRLSEGWRPYTGTNPHDKHVHVSVTTRPGGFDSTAPWGWDTPTQEDPMANLDEAALDQIAEAVWRRKFPSDKTAGQMLGGVYSRTLATRDLARDVRRFLKDETVVSEDELADALSKALSGKQ